jgi:hypothetical protein
MANVTIERKSQSVLFFRFGKILRILGSFFGIIPQASRQLFFFLS